MTHSGDHSDDSIGSVTVVYILTETLENEIKCKMKDLVIMSLSERLKYDPFWEYQVEGCEAVYYLCFLRHLWAIVTTEERQVQIKILRV